MQVFSVRFHYFISCFSFASHLSLFLKKRRDCGVLGTSIRNCKLSGEDGVKKACCLCVHGSYSIFWEKDKEFSRTKIIFQGIFFPNNMK